jgi:hypothetical protein
MFSLITPKMRRALPIAPLNRWLALLSSASSVTYSTPARDHDLGARERRPAFERQQAVDAIRMEMRDDHGIDLAVSEARCFQVAMELPGLAVAFRERTLAGSGVDDGELGAGGGSGKHAAADQLVMTFLPSGRAYWLFSGLHRPYRTGYHGCRDDAFQTPACRSYSRPAGPAPAAE